MRRGCGLTGWTRSASLCGWLGLGLIGGGTASGAATVTDYLQDGWDLQGFSNSVNAQIVLR
jgi:hypothetical protein